MLSLKVWGPYACFTRPEHKVERVSHEVMTPSAARGILEAVLWKPEFQWQVREIVVLNEIKWHGLTRNEVTKVASAREAGKWSRRGGGFDVGAYRTQRHSLILKDVAYIIRAEMVLQPGAIHPVQKYADMFSRRVAKGQAFHQPYFGNREFSAFFSAPDGTERAANIIRQLGDPQADEKGQLSLGLMLFDIQFFPAEAGPLTFRQHTPAGSCWGAGRAMPRFFEATLSDRGVLKVPAHLYGAPL